MGRSLFYRFGHFYSRVHTIQVMLLKVDAKTIIVVTDAGLSVEKKIGSWAFYLMSEQKDVGRNGKFKDLPANIGEAEAKAMIQALSYLPRQFRSKEIRTIKVFCDNLEVVRNGKNCKGKYWHIMAPVFNSLISQYDCQIQVFHLNTRTVHGLLRHVHALCDYRTKEHIHKKPKSYIDKLLN